MGQSVDKGSRQGGLPEAAENQDDAEKTDHACTDSRDIAPTTEEVGENIVVTHEYHADPRQRDDKKNKSNDKHLKAVGEIILEYIF
jgi:hypothetical protein